MSDPELPKLVVPGDYLGAAEEFLPGRGTYENRGRIYASLLGTPRVDPRDKSIRVDARNGIPEVQEDDLVYARVDELKTAMAICTILTAGDNPRPVPGGPEGTVHISKAKEGYTESLSEVFAVGDTLLARVLQSHPSVKLTTAAAPLGVVAARCQVCHALLRIGPKELVCPRCGHTEHRKLAQGPRPGPSGPNDRSSP
ncbi:MAG: exosome complex RNA-binding protein Csl4 [Thermoplasmata archaeon]|jgi:exosome complex component CSL4|nr:exosome complex RNA-binding protein Csl4 [Thermoplasmata archaeon]